MEIGIKIKSILKEKKIKDISLIRHLLGKEIIEDKERTQFSRYLSGQHKFPSEYIIRTAMFLKVDPKILLGANQSKTKGLVEVPAKLVPVIGSSGCSVPAESYFDDYYDSDTVETAPFAGDENMVYAIKAFGDSMENYISDGNICFF